MLQWRNPNARQNGGDLEGPRDRNSRCHYQRIRSLGRRYRRASLPFTRDAEGQQERNLLLTTSFPTRTDFLVHLLRQNSLYPQTAAPDLECSREFRALDDGGAGTALWHF